MKKLTIVLLVLAAFTSNVNAQKKNASSNRAFRMEFIDYNSYSDYAGYSVALTNYTDQTITIEIELLSVGITETFTLEPFAYNIFLVGHSDENGTPALFVPNMWIRATIIAPFHSTLKVRTTNPYGF